jgi:hypothetical protein
MNITHEQALQVLIESAVRGQSKGIFTLEEAATVLQAINAFKSPVPVSPEATEEVDQVEEVNSEKKV